MTSEEAGRGITPRPKVSVLMTIYNAAPFLRQSIGSVLGQSFDSWELVAVENGSSDGSRAILEGYQDARMRPIFLHTNIGRTAALRLALDRAAGEYIAVLDADDIAYPDRLAKQVRYLESHPEVVLLGTWVRNLDGANVEIGTFAPPADPQSLVELLGSGNPIVHSSAMYRAAAARSVGGYPVDTPYSQDYRLWLKLLEHGRPAVLTEYLCGFRIQPESITQSRRNRVVVARDLLGSMIAAGRQLQLDAPGRRRNREEVAIARVRYALALMRNGHVGSGLCALWFAAARDPVRLMNNRLTRSFLCR
jgi:hypothetical protein